jgi:hypothetical protein
MSRLPEQEPIRVKRGDEEIETHPAYAMIGASRVSGSTRLFGSEFKHEHFVTISIHAAELHRNLSRDWHFARNEYIEVALSESQWASFVSSMNVGNGVPCTLEHRDMHQVPGIKGQAQAKTTFKAEFKETMNKSLASLDSLAALIGECKMSEKAKAQLLGSVHMAKQHIESNIPFVANQFSEHMEDTVEKMKTEVGAYIQAVISRTGIEALKGKSPVVLDAGETTEELGP